MMRKRDSNPTSVVGEWVEICCRLEVGSRVEVGGKGSLEYLLWWKDREKYSQCVVSGRSVVNFSVRLRVVIIRFMFVTFPYSEKSMKHKKAGNFN